jgi:hypothetical protein
VLAVEGREPVKGSVPRLEEHGQSFGDAQRGLPSQGETHQLRRCAVEEVAGLALLESPMRSFDLLDRRCGDLQRRLAHAFTSNTPLNQAQELYFFPPRLREGVAAERNSALAIGSLWTASWAYERWGWERKGTS